MLLTVRTVQEAVLEMARQKDNVTGSTGDCTIHKDDATREAINSAPATIHAALSASGTGGSADGAYQEDKARGGTGDGAHWKDNAEGKTVDGAHRKDKARGSAGDGTDQNDDARGGA